MNDIIYIGLLILQIANTETLRSGQEEPERLICEGMTTNFVMGRFLS